MAWLYTVLNPTKAAGGFGTHGYMLYSLGYTVEYWIHQKQPVEFDGFGTHGYMLYSLGYTVEYWIHQNQEKDCGGFGVVMLLIHCYFKTFCMFLNHIILCRYKCKKEGLISENSNYYIFKQLADGSFEAVPLKLRFNELSMILSPVRRSDTKCRKFKICINIFCYIFWCTHEKLHCHKVGTVLNFLWQ